MHYVYVLKSLKDNNLYIGRTNDIERRLSEHNYGHTQSTKSRRPFVLLKKIEVESEAESLRIEKELKKGYKREELKREFGL
jgi:putative endonuclease